MANADHARKTYEYLKNSFPSFSVKLLVALEGIDSKKAQLAYIQEHDVRYNGALVHGTMLQAAQNVHDKLDERGRQSLREIEQKWKGDQITGSFTLLNRMIQLCSQEAAKAKGGLWGGLDATALVNEFLEYLLLSLIHI